MKTTTEEKLELQNSKMSEECSALAASPSILAALDTDIRRSGFSGPATIAQLVYLAITSRFLPKPVSIVIKGPSGSGKSYALNAALKFAPPAAYESFSGMSERALVYSSMNLKHRCLVIQEAAGLSDGVGRAYLRQLLSEGTVRYQTVVNTKDGLVGKELPRIEGPISLLMTTTANGLHLEDESRMLTVHVDESQDRIRQALLAQAMGPSENGTVIETKHWHELHDFIGKGTLKVSIPFAKVLAENLPTSHFRATRDFPQVLSLITAHALLHQCTRERLEDGTIIATLADYASVYDLVGDIIAQGLEAAIPANIKELVEATKALLGMIEPTKALPFMDVEGVSQRQLAVHLGRDQSVVSRTLAAAIAQGYLLNETPGQGRQSSIKLGERDVPTGFALPSPEKLAELITN